MKYLETIASQIKTGWELCGSKWKNCEAETIVLRTISACANNLKSKGDAFSWLAGSCTTGRQQCGTNNARGLQMLINDGSIVQEDYTGPHEPPAGTATHDSKPQVLRVTNSLLLYVVSHMKIDQ